MSPEFQTRPKGAPLIHYNDSGSAAAKSPVRVLAEGAQLDHIGVLNPLPGSLGDVPLLPLRPGLRRSGVDHPQAGVDLDKFA